MSERENELMGGINAVWSALGENATIDDYNYVLRALFGIVERTHSPECAIDLVNVIAHDLWLVYSKRGRKNAHVTDNSETIGVITPDRVEEILKARAISDNETRTVG